MALHGKCGYGGGASRAQERNDVEFHMSPYRILGHYYHKCFHLCRCKCLHNFFVHGWREFSLDQMTFFQLFQQRSLQRCKGRLQCLKCLGISQDDGHGILVFGHFQGITRKCSVFEPRRTCRCNQGCFSYIILFGDGFGQIRVAFGGSSYLAVRCHRHGHSRGGGGGGFKLYRNMV